MNMRDQTRDSQPHSHLECISAFMDGELDAAGCENLMQAARHDPQTCSEWAIYHCIGDVLRSDDMACHSAAITGRVLARLESEPHLFAPASVRAPEAVDSVQTHRKRLIGLVAAGSAAVAVFGAAMFPQWGPSQGDQLAKQSSAPSTLVAADIQQSGVTAAVEPIAPVSAEYLVAHRQYSSGIAMRGVVSHVRTAGYDGK